MTSQRIGKSGNSVNLDVRPRPVRAAKLNKTIVIKLQLSKFQIISEVVTIISRRSVRQVVMS